MFIIIWPFYYYLVAEEYVITRYFQRKYDTERGTSSCIFPASSESLMRCVYIKAGLFR